MKTIGYNFIAIIVGMSLVACATMPEVELAEKMVQAQNWDEAVRAYQAAVLKEPFDQELAAKLSEVKKYAAEVHYKQGRQFLKEKKLPQALQEFQMALGLDPEKSEHHAALGDAVRLKEARNKLSDAENLRTLGRLDEALSAYERAIELDPTLTQALEGITAIAERQMAQKAIGGTTETVTLRFQNTRLKQVFEILARTANINIIFEKDVRDDLVTIFAKDTPFDEAMNLILTTNQLFARRVAPDTLLIIPDTKQKRQQYQDLMIRTFYLSNSKAKDMANLLRTILETKRVYVNEPLNTVVIRDQPEKLQLAENVILANDRRDAEVVLDVEVLEVNNSFKKMYGFNFAKSAGAGIFQEGTTSFSTTALTWTYEQLASLGPESYLFTFPGSFLFEFFKTESKARTLANPKLRVLNNEKASINVGDKQPILLSTTNTQPGQASSGAVPVTSTVTSIEFKDTGVKLDVEPTIHLTGEITIKLKVEVIRLGELVTLQEDPKIQQFRFGTRTAETVLNLRDGETVILAGLIQDINRRTKDTIPGLDDISLIEDLFGTTDDKTADEIILAITPRIVRNVKPPTVVKQTLWSGTATQYATTPLFSEPDHSVVVAKLEGDAVGIPTKLVPDKAEEVQPLEAPVPLSPPSPDTETEQQQVAKAVGPSSAKIRLDPPEITTRIGQTIEVVLVGEALPEVDKVQVMITYNPKVLEFAQALPGELWEQDESSPALTVSVTPERGQIMLQLGRPGEKAQGGGRLATLTLTGKAKGNSAIVMRQPSLSLGEGKPMPVTVQHGMIRVL